uniref:Transposase n=1 Tax=Globodera rostochiensis TaxID=31243 RepID=A0A914H8A3_GLORO
MKAELTRAGFKNSYKNEIDETVAKELSLSLATIYNWKSELGQIGTNYSNDEKLEIVKKLMQMESAHSGADKKSCKEIDKNPKICDEEIAKRLKIGIVTLYKWKKQFKRQQFHPNSVDGLSVEENAAANVQEIGNSNSEII